MYEEFGVSLGSVVRWEQGQDWEGAGNGENFFVFFAMEGHQRHHLWGR